MSIVARSLAAGSAGVAAVALTVALPLAAVAAPHNPYTPLKPDPWAMTVSSCSVAKHQIAAGTFDGNAPLELSVTGTSAAPTLATFTASQLTAQMKATAAGGATIDLNFGNTARGTYDVTLTEPGTANAAYGVVTVTPACGASDSVPVAVAADPAPLAKTGTNISYGVVWAAASAVAIGIVFALIARARRRLTRER